LALIFSAPFGTGGRLPGALQSNGNHNVGRLGLAVRLATRFDGAGNTDTVLAYAHASGRTFPTLPDQLAWADREAVQILRQRNGYMNLYTGDLTDVTDTVRIVHRRDP